MAGSWTAILTKIKTQVFCKSADKRFISRADKQKQKGKKMKAVIILAALAICLCICFGSLALPLLVIGGGILLGFVGIVVLFNALEDWNERTYNQSKNKNSSLSN